jgi:tetratricopeptide (TPR) repeat protein
MAIKLEPTFALAYAHLGRLLRSRGLTKESNEAYQKAIELSEDVPTMILVAEVLQSQQRFNESEQLLRDALKIDAKHPTALFLLGRALITRGNFVEAEEVLTKSVEVSPDSFVSYTLLGSVYFRQKKWGKAEETLNKALRVVSPNEKKRLAQEFETVGDAFVKNKKYADASRIYKRAVSLNDEKVSLKVKLAEAENNNNGKLILENE